MLTMKVRNAQKLKFSVAKTFCHFERGQEGFQSSVETRNNMFFVAALLKPFDVVMIQD